MTTTKSPPSTRAWVPKSMLRSTSKESSRYAIAGVHVFVGPHGKGYAAATNGRLAALRQIEGEKSDGFRSAITVPAEVMVGKSAKRCPRPDHYDIEIVGEKATNHSTGTFVPMPEAQAFPGVDGVLPEWEKPGADPADILLKGMMKAGMPEAKATALIIRAEEARPRSVIGLSAAFLQDIARTLDAEMDHVCIAFRESGKPIIVMTSNGETDGVGVLMPVTSDAERMQERYARFVAGYKGAVEGKWPEEEAEEPPKVVMKPVIGVQAAAVVAERKPDKPGVVPDSELATESTCDDERGFLGQVIDAAQERLADSTCQGREALEATVRGVETWLALAKEGKADPASAGWDQVAEFDIPLSEGDKTVTIRAVFLPTAGDARFEFHGPISDSGFLACSLAGSKPPEGRSMMEHAIVLAAEARQTFTTRREVMSRKRGPRKPVEAPPPQKPVQPPPPEDDGLTPRQRELLAKWGPKPVAA